MGICDLLVLAQAVQLFCVRGKDYTLTGIRNVLSLSESHSKEMSHGNARHV
jgi:hypothetical protein